MMFCVPLVYGMSTTNLRVKSARYYPCTEDGELVGWKCRQHPKTFGVGILDELGNTCNLYGQFKFGNGGKVC